MFKKRSAPTTKNVRPKANDNDDEEEDTTVVYKPVTETSKRKAVNEDDPESSSSSSSSSSSNAIAAAVTHIFESTRELVAQQYAGDATSTTIVDNEAVAVGHKHTGYVIWFNPVSLSLLMSNTLDSYPILDRFGPVKAPTFLRVTSRFDYQPDICKDYKETGFCGFGDSCKFLHDRGDYKSGWQMEREWDAQQAKKKKKMEESIQAFGDSELEKEGKTEGNDDDDDDDEDDDDNKYAIDSDEEDLPFACYICREDFTNPVVTVCGHYFCGDCAMNSAKKSGNKCAVCNKQTFGVFNRAHKLLKRIAMKKGGSTVDGGATSSSSAGAVLPPPVVRKGTWETVDG